MGLPEERGLVGRDPVRQSSQLGSRRVPRDVVVVCGKAGQLQFAKTGRQACYQQVAFAVFQVYAGLLENQGAEPGKLGVGDIGDAEPGSALI